jgi:hypothetical protein
MEYCVKARTIGGGSQETLGEGEEARRAVRRQRKLYSDPNSLFTWSTWTDSSCPFDPSTVRRAHRKQARGKHAHREQAQDRPSGVSGDHGCRHLPSTSTIGLIPFSPPI